MTEELVEKVALAMWKQREEMYPAFTRRLVPDDLDRVGGAWMVMILMARQAVRVCSEHMERLL